MGASGTIKHVMKSESRDKLRTRCQNKAAFIDFLWHTFMGIYGRIFDQETREPIGGAEIFVAECNGRSCFKGIDLTLE